MYKLHTRKQELYFDEVIRLHYEKGYGEDRISTIIPVGHSTVNRWIRIFAAEKETGKRVMPETRIKEKKTIPESAESETVTRVGYERLKAKLEMAEIKAERVNSTMKNELLKGMVFHDICDVRRAVSRAVDFYNNEART